MDNIYVFFIKKANVTWLCKCTLCKRFRTVSWIRWSSKFPSSWIILKQSNKWFGCNRCSEHQGLSVRLLMACKKSCYLPLPLLFSINNTCSSQRQFFEYEQLRDIPLFSYNQIYHQVPGNTQWPEKIKPWHFSIGTLLLLEIRCTQVEGNLITSLEVLVASASPWALFLKILLFLKEVGFIPEKNHYSCLEKQ